MSVILERVRTIETWNLKTQVPRRELQIGVAYGRAAVQGPTVERPQETPFVTAP
jgi:hypothetical protein